MCVILVCSQGIAPNQDVLEACAERNDHGAGIAWRDGDVVRWEKGVNMKVPDVQAIMKRIKFPYIIHFRISSVGMICNELCHPFPIGGLDTRREGQSRHGVVFHNGTWHLWKSDLKDWCRTTGHRIPDGRLSDSRAMAILAGTYGPNWLTLMDEKIAFLTPTQCEIVGTTVQWSRRDSQGRVCLGNEAGIWFSNDHWEKKVVSTVGTNASVEVHSSWSRGRGGVNPPLPSMKPADCQHSGSFHFVDGRRFCTPCGIRLEAVGNKPWVAPQTVATSDATTVVDHVGNIAKRVHRLVAPTSTATHMH